MHNKKSIKISPLSGGPVNANMTLSPPSFSWKHLVTISTDTFAGRVELAISEKLFSVLPRTSRIVKSILPAFTLALTLLPHTIDILWSTVQFSVSPLPIGTGPSSHHLKNVVASVVLLVTIPFRMIAYVWTLNERVLFPIDFHRRLNHTSHFYIQQGRMSTTDEAWLCSLIESHPPDRSTLSREDNFWIDLLQCPGGCELVRWRLSYGYSWEEVVKKAAREGFFQALRLCLMHDPELIRRDLDRFFFSAQPIQLIGRIALMPGGAEFLTDQVFAQGEWSQEHLQPGWEAKIALWATEHQHRNLIDNFARLVQAGTSLSFNGVNPLSLCIDKMANPELSENLRNSFKEIALKWKWNGWRGLSFFENLGNGLTPFLKGLYKFTGPDYLPPQIKKELEDFLVKQFPRSIDSDWINQTVKNAQGEDETLIAYAAKRGLYGFIYELTWSNRVPPTPRHMTSPLTAAILSSRDTPFREWIIRRLLEKGADPNISFSNGHTPLTYAVAFQDYELAKMLLVNGARPNDSCDHPHWFRKTPIEIARDTGDAQMQEILLKSGASRLPQTPPRPKPEEKLIHPELLQLQMHHASPLLPLFVALKRASQNHQFWKILGADAPLTKQELDTAFRKIAKIAHPDKAAENDKIAALEITKALIAIRGFLEKRIAPATP